MITRPYIPAILALINVLGAPAVWDLSPWWWVLMAFILFLNVVAVYDMLQKKHSILRNFPVIGHLRYIGETTRPETQQYFIEHNLDGAPFDRDTRTMVYERAKGLSSKKSFGTERKINAPGYEYVRHSMAPNPYIIEDPCVDIGDPDCTQSYSVSTFNISTMSFGSLPPNVVMAMNKGTKLGDFVQDTGEGTISPYHLEYSADTYWQLGSGHSGARAEDGDFDPKLFREKTKIPRVKATYLEVSQGAKSGLGGILPGHKVNEEIAATRHVPVGRDVMSPPYHHVYSTPRELVRFMGTIRELNGDKPAGFKLCVGSQLEFLTVRKAMLEENITPDFIIVDGAEGGTGAAPLEYFDRVGLPLTDGPILIHNALADAGLRDRIKLGASDKVITGFDIVKHMYIDVDFVNLARGMMMATECIQSQLCHTDTCPVGMATQDPKLWKALNVDDKGQCVTNCHNTTVKEAANLLASMGLKGFSELGPTHLLRRASKQVDGSCAELYNWLQPGELLSGTHFHNWTEAQETADLDTFHYPAVCMRG